MGKMFIVTHKEFKAPSIKNYEIITVNGLELEGAHKDCEGINISKKNNSFCELTALYWIWKNFDKTNIGLSHYRRYFYNNIFSKKQKNIVTVDKLDEYLNEYDIILPKIHRFPRNVREQYYMSGCGFEEDLNRLIKTIVNIYPDYQEACDKVLNGNKTYLYNMFYTSSKWFDSYCEWLFSILFEFEKNTNTENYSPYQKRIYGFLSERMLAIWVTHNNLKIKELPVMNSETSLTKEYKNLFFDNLKALLKYNILSKIKGDI